MDECSCVYTGASDGEVAEFSHTTMRKAIKEHKCGECCTTIRKGEIYEVNKAKFEGTIDTFKTCVVCKEIRDTFFCEGFYYGCMWEEFREHMREMHGEVSTVTLNRLTPRARDKVFELMDESVADVEDEEIEVGTRKKGENKNVSL